MNNNTFKVIFELLDTIDYYEKTHMIDEDNIPVEYYRRVKKLLKSFDTCRPVEYTD